MKSGPDEYTDGLSELVRGMRIYIGLSVTGMATKIGMSERTYRRIENGDRDCPPGLLDTLTAIGRQFDSEVVDIRCSYSGGDAARVAVSDAERDEWRRCVVLRAAVQSDNIIPVLMQ